MTCILNVCQFGVFVEPGRNGVVLTLIYYYQVFLLKLDRTRVNQVLDIFHQSSGVLNFFFTAPPCERVQFKTLTFENIRKMSIILHFSYQSQLQFSAPVSYFYDFMNVIVSFSPFFLLFFFNLQLSINSSKSKPNAIGNFCNMILMF